MEVNNELAGIIMRLNHKIQALTGEVDALAEIKVSPRVFDLMVVDAHKLPLSQEDARNGVMPRSMFKPSDAYCFRLCGVKISPSLN